MAIIPYTKEWSPDQSIIFTWDNFHRTNAEDFDVAIPYKDCPFDHRCFQVREISGSGWKIGLEGSIDGIVWGTLTDSNGNEIETNKSNPLSFDQYTKYLRPYWKAGNDCTVAVMIYGRMSRTTKR